MQKEIKHEWIYEQSPREIWKYLTKAELIALWLMPNNFKLKIGHEFQLTTKPMPALDLDGVFQCKVLEIEPYQKLSYSWKGGSGNGIFTLDTICEWTLEPHKKGTKLKLKHSGFGENNTDIFIGMTDGWLKKIEQMLELINA
ncbi:SRPBCC domain-containing protein [Galbibacter sp. EGI 63066]|uniref:SRPBCC family protein n=1 Tax=Galbibacter sp. EGI 63066 TaxID=2993559 RepID=UPI0022491970|nr:SRPBCC domain-containing protein [Galbibacter sp. EGI 63066]MCX2680255.1 SRPBCC domain-containing protein [Galbibacter sp. EGI 63066]